MNYSSNASAWSVIWNGIISFFTAVKDIMDGIIIFSLGGSFQATLWDFCLGVIIMGAIIGQFIIFAQPSLPDKPVKNWQEDRANKRYMRSQISNKRKG